MQKQIAFCGIICDDCPAFIATQKNDDEERKKVVELWAKYNLDLKPEDVNCDGCLIVGGRLIHFCEYCEVRRCGLEKNIKNCAYCGEYPCGKLDEVFKMVPDAKAKLDEIKNSL